MFSSRTEKIAKIAQETHALQQLLQSGSVPLLQLAISRLEGALAGVPFEGKGEDVVHAAINALADARPVLAKLRATQEHELEARVQARVQRVAQPCVRCSGCDILVGEGARIAINGKDNDDVGVEHLACTILVCASCGDVRMVADIADVAAAHLDGRRFFVRTTAAMATPYR